MDYNKAALGIEHYMDLLRQNPIMVHDDEVIHHVLECSAVILPRFKLMCVDSVQNVLYDDFKQLGLTFNSFYNETMQFILDNKRRITATGTYSSLLTAYISDIEKTQHPADFGSIGQSILNGSFGRAGTVRSFGKAHQSTTVDKRALSYADHELLAQWITRVNGLSDMITSLSVFLKIARP